MLDMVGRPEEAVDYATGALVNAQVGPPARRRAPGPQRLRCWLSPTLPPIQPAGLHRRTQPA